MKIENTTDAQIDLSYVDENGVPAVITIPAGTKQGDLARVNGVLDDADGATIERIKKESLPARSYFETGMLIADQKPHDKNAEENKPEQTDGTLHMPRNTTRR